jgi:N6-adenosine-specific RNA methylase IME4
MPDRQQWMTNGRTCTPEEKQAVEAAVRRDVQLIAEHYGRTDLDNIEREYLNDDHGEFLASLWGPSLGLEPTLPTFHPATEIFPMMTDDNLIELANDTREHGQGEPIVLDRDLLIIDGRNRFVACSWAGVEPKFRYTTDEENRVPVVDLVCSWNMKQRHLTKDQQVAVAAKMIPLLEEEKRKAKLSGKSADGSAGGRGRKTTPGKERHARSSAGMAASYWGVSRGQVERFRRIEARAPDLALMIFDGLLTISQAFDKMKERDLERKRAENAAKIAKNNPKSIQEALDYGIEWATILIDPPWDYKEAGSDAGVPYAPMSFEKIWNLRLPAEDDCHLYLWTTNRLLPRAFDLLKKWEFKYSCTITWNKKQILQDGSIGSRGRPASFLLTTEYLIFARRGSLPLKGHAYSVPTCHEFSIPRNKWEHSKKPGEFIDLIEACSPGHYLEIFSRSDRPNWSSAGENGLKLAKNLKGARRR